MEKIKLRVSGLNYLKLVGLRLKFSSHQLDLLHADKVKDCKLDSAIIWDGGRRKGRNTLRVEIECAPNLSALKLRLFKGMSVILISRRNLTP
jgi:hypothetical protein